MRRLGSTTVLLAAATLVAACGEEPAPVATTADINDYNHDGLLQAVDKFVANGRSPEAYAQMASTVLSLRSGFDRSVGEEAELKLIVLALAPMQAMANRPLDEQVDTLAKTVYPTLLAPKIEADAILIKRDPKSADLFPKADETTREYLQRLCGGPLAGDCKAVVPEYQGAVVASVAIRRGVERARNAVVGCQHCTADPQWHESVRTWESLDRVANGWIHEVERRGSPDNWPIAGNASEADPKLPEAFVDAAGELVVGTEKHHDLKERNEALAKLRGSRDAITLNLRPELTLAQVKALLTEAKRAGAKKVALVARAPQFPWEKRVYWFSAEGKVRANLRPTDSLQLLLHTLDHVSGPGSVARVD